MDNQTIIQYFEWDLPPDGLLWQRAAAQAKALKEIGFDIVWLPPAYKGTEGANDVGYGVYDLYDLGEFDQKGTVPTKYGTKEEYLAGVKALQKEGIAVLADIVLDHRMGADETEEVNAEQFDQADRNKQIAGETTISAWTKFTFPGRAGKYSDFIWDWKCFSAVDWDEKSKQSGIFRFSGKDWPQDVDKENGNFDYLMGADVDVRNPEVVKELNRWGRWYLKTTKVDGFRLDAVKHISEQFYCEWLDEAREESEKDLFSVGEYWSGDLGELTDYIASCEGRMSLFDVPLHFHFHEASTNSGKYDMRNLMQDTLVAADTMHAVTFVDNHDSQPGQSLASWVEDWFKPLAYAVILLRRDGLPCVFYADYYGLRSDGGPAVPDIKRLVAVRRWYAYGDQHDYFDNEDLVGWTREGDEEHPNSGCAVLLTDGPGGEKAMYVGKQFAGRVFRDVTRRFDDEIVIGDDGNATFKVEGGAVSVWVPEEAYQRIAVEIE